MSEDGGPAHEMSLRELYAILLEVAYTLGQDGEPDSLHIAAIFDEAQALTNEAMKRRKYDPRRDRKIPALHQDWDPGDAPLGGGYSGAPGEGEAQ